MVFVLWWIDALWVRFSPQVIYFSLHAKAFCANEYGFFDGFSKLRKGVQKGQ